MAHPVESTGSRGVVALMVVVATIAATAAICQVWTRLRAIEYGYKISKATREHTKLLEANRRLRLEVALLKNPARIARLAEELGLRHARTEQVRRLRDPLRHRGVPTRGGDPGVALLGGARR
jgi:cell division protein FtsL